MLPLVAQEYSFDVVSDFDRQELVNAVDQARREIGQRYDFKGATAEISLERDHLVLLASSALHLRSMFDVLQSRLHRRGIDLRVLDPQEPEPAAKGTLRQVVRLRRGIAEDLARDLVKRIRAASSRVQVRVEGEKLRVVSRAKDDLQTVIRVLRSLDLDVPLQFTNYR